MVIDLIFLYREYKEIYIFEKIKFSIIIYNFVENFIII